MPEAFNVTLLRDATEDGAVYGSKAVGEPPLMLAFSVREALRQAAAAFGPAGTSVHLASPATPEAVFWAIQSARGQEGSDVTEGFPGREPPVRDPDAEADAEVIRAAAARGACLMAPGSTRSSGCARLASRRCWSPSPRCAGTHRAAAGAKMVVSATGAWGSIGGGNVEALAIERARAQLADPDAGAGDDDAASCPSAPRPSTAPSAAAARSPCCSSRCRPVPAVAIFGVGHVGLELARILARHDLELHLIDTRPEILAESRLAVLADAVATRPRPPGLGAAGVGASPSCPPAATC